MLIFANYTHSRYFWIARLDNVNLPNSRHLDLWYDIMVNHWREEL